MPVQGHEVDVLIVGAGVSGVGIACHLQRRHPQRSVAVLEAREGLGGTWDLFRYPGVRSDSDLATFGYEFKPWTAREMIADGSAILDYVGEAAREHGVDEKIRFGHRVTAARWDSARAQWTVSAEAPAEQGGTQTFVARWLVCAGGYYRYDRGYQAEIPGIENFGGTVVHPQFWDESLDYAGKRVVVIGSGATAVTVVPAMARTAEHVTMLQRSPTYILSAPQVDPLAQVIRRLFDPERAHELNRNKNVAMGRRVYGWCRAYPGLFRRMIRTANKMALPRGYDVDQHFSPRYDPWDQRMCLVPDGDLFKAIKAGKADVVTDHITGFSEGEIELRSGQRLQADIVVTATGLELLPFGGMQLTVDGEDVDVAERFSYKGMMLTGVPNFVFAIGYVNASWTLKVDLIAGHFCRILERMDQRGEHVAVADAPPQGTVARPLLEFGANYVQRGFPLFPRQGDASPYVQSMDYAEDVALLREGPVGDRMRFDPGDRERAEQDALAV